MKKITYFIICVLTLLLTVTLTGCGKKVYTIGILQPLEHEALNFAREGFIEALKQEGYIDGENIKIIYQNANGVEADLNTLAKSLTSQCDMTLGIGTGATQALQAAQVNSGSNKPILFTAVTDAVAGGLVESNENPNGFITGTSDANPVEAQIQLIKECNPEAKKLGIMYTQSEVNSEVQANQAKAAAEKEGMTVVIETCTDSSDISAVALHLCASEIDALYIPTDNNCAANMPAVKAAVDQYHILCVCGEESTVSKGGHITLSVDYKELGKKVGNIAVQIIRDNKNPSDFSVTSMSKEECSYIICPQNLQDSGIQLSIDLSKFKQIEAK